MSRLPVSRADREKFSGRRELCVTGFFQIPLSSRVVQFLLSPIFWDTHGGSADGESESFRNLKATNYKKEPDQGQTNTPHPCVLD